jgi:hypothetical protein
LREEAVKAKRRGRKCKKVQEVERRREQSSGDAREAEKAETSSMGHQIMRLFFPYVQC